MEGLLQKKVRIIPVCTCLFLSIPVYSCLFLSIPKVASYDQLNSAIIALHSAQIFSASSTATKHQNQVSYI